MEAYYPLKVKFRYHLFFICKRNKITIIRDTSYLLDSSRIFGHVGCNCTMSSIEGYFLEQMGAKW